jgi:hypothetical protein
MRAAMRAAAVTLLEGYKTANAGSLRQVYKARPMSLQAPAAFVDSLDESEINYTPAGMQRTPDVVIRLVRGTFSSGDVADANDELVDDFIDYVVDNRHVAGGNTLSLITSVEDDDGWVPEWIPVPAGSDPRPYYSTLVTLSGEGLLPGVL